MRGGIKLKILAIAEPPAKKHCIPYESSSRFSKEFRPHSEIIEYNMNKLNCKGCQGCLACKKPDVKTCSSKTFPVLEQMIEADVCFGTPVYGPHFCTTKLCWTECTVSQILTDLCEFRKKCLFVITQGCRRPPQDIMDLFSRFMSWRGVSTKFIRAAGLTLSSVYPETLEEARNLEGG